MKLFNGKLIFGKPAEMDQDEVSVALYHIATNTDVSHVFTAKFASDVMLRASTLLSTPITTETPADTPDCTMSDAERQLRDDYSWDDGITVDWEPPSIACVVASNNDTLSKLSQNDTTMEKIVAEEDEARNEIAAIFADFWDEVFSPPAPSKPNPSNSPYISTYDRNKW